ncbi:MAG: sodium:proton antiporter [Clostridiales Family XIII bacterium]|nr:sodium:proton antiporter [Clostridiales Family XIII bacterium]
MEAKSIVSSKVRWIFIIVVVILLTIPSFLAEGGEEGELLGNLLPVWSIIPFVGMLLSIAIVPLVKGEWWEHNLFNVAIIWSLVFLVPFAIGFGPHEAGKVFYESVALDYLPFIVLLLGLFAVSGGIVLKGSLAGTTKVNLLLLAVGIIIASWVGTTGASMLMIRPILKANAWREKKAHVVVFFIFLVSNIGGCLTPLGDPPLFLGFLRGVPFFWTMRLAPLLLFNAVILLIAFIILDKKLLKKEYAAGRKPVVDEPKEKLRVEGLHNFIFLLIIVGAVILSGSLASTFTGTDGEALGIPLPYDLVLPGNNVIQMVLILLAAFLSIKTTKKDLHESNGFTWGPIQEVGSLFIGIFITMIPALAILNAKGASLGLTEPWQFFWASGALSSFLDNAPTYLVFGTTGASLGASAGVAFGTVGTISIGLLAAVSAGAVFMGANTYIGNAPNFMVRSIAEENGVKMPSFFGYMWWSLRFLIPTFILDTLLFFCSFSPFAFLVS